MRVAYADPPYVGQSRKHYGREEVDHPALVAQLRTFDSWALSASSPSLRELWNLCPEARVGIWVKPFCSFKPGVNPAYAWEPVLFVSSRKRGRKEPTVRDFVSCNMTMKKGLAGAKQDDFCYWLFELLGMKADDVFYDLFLGTGRVTRAWEAWKPHHESDCTACGGGEIKKQEVQR